ncbi:hypothetical protein [Rhizobium leguminosarum]|uniref:hypothetical protein n=1 Tax=Rhizobium leguminosarum TaxID=384 RepID=UPI001441A792|nr:hypothetical protein [Rhizobium leguminosarum]MBY5863298.1 hypothetical protein [Rhizobium leguminosarum]NKM04176.1 hypothetical protein [Rhizobium leguminosarum bv. viciae]
MSAFHDERITDYLRKFPEVRREHVARIFGVEPCHVSALRKKAGAYTARKAAAVARNMKAADLDDAILAAVYKRGLVDMVLKP